MKTVKKVTALLLSLALIVIFAFSTMAATNQVGSCGASGIEIQPYYVNINTTSLTQGKTWVSADVQTKSKMSLRIDIKIYKNGSLVLSDYATGLS